VAEITVRRRGELVRGVFAALMDKPDGLPAAQVLKAVEQIVPPSPRLSAKTGPLQTTE